MLLMIILHIVQFCAADLARGLYLLDSTRISQLVDAAGKTRRRFPALSGLQLALTCTSASGTVLAGLTVRGHMFTWLQPSHQLAIYTSPVSQHKSRLEDLAGT